MPKYMFTGRYVTAAIATMVKYPEDRTGVVRELVESCGGKLEGFWLALGEHDFVGISDFPNATAAAAMALAAAAGGGVQDFRTTELLEWAEGVRAMKKAAAAKYRPPTTAAK